MKVSTKGRYALRMMVDIANRGEGGYISLRDIAQRQSISMKYMEQIVGLLTKSGFLHSVRGPRGGYRLARDAKEYTVGDILRVTEGDLAPVSCVVRPDSGCPRVAGCPTYTVWSGLYENIIRYVDSITLAQLAQDPGRTDVLGECR